MSNDYFRFKQFVINQGSCAFKVGTDGVLLGALAGVEGRKSVLDIGTGTGLIALMMAQRCDAEIVAIEPDYSSFQQARENTGNSQWRNRIEVVNSRLQDYYPGERLFDLTLHTLSVRSKTSILRFRLQGIMMDSRIRTSLRVRPGFLNHVGNCSLFFHGMKEISS